jgi:hypothetical protein
MRFCIKGKYTRGWAVGPWEVDAPTAEAAWLQAEELGIVVTAVVGRGESDHQQVSVLNTRPATLPPQAFAPSLAGVVWTTLLALVDLFVCFVAMIASRDSAILVPPVGLLVFLVAAAVMELVRYFHRYVDYKIGQYHARSCLAERGAADERWGSPSSAAAMIRPEAERRP